MFCWDESTCHLVDSWLLEVCWNFLQGPGEIAIVWCQNASIKAKRLSIRLPNWPYYWYMFICIYVYIIYIHFNWVLLQPLSLNMLGYVLALDIYVERTKSHPNPSGILQVLRVVAHLRSRSRNHLFQRIQPLSIANKAVFRPVVWVGTRQLSAISWSHLDLDFYVKNGI